MTCILGPPIEHSSISCVLVMTPWWPTPPRTTKHPSCWIQVAPKRDRSVEEAGSVSAGLKAIEGAFPCQRSGCTLVVCFTYLVITQD